MDTTNISIICTVAYGITGTLCWARCESIFFKLWAKDMSPRTKERLEKYSFFLPMSMFLIWPITLPIFLIRMKRFRRRIRSEKKFYQDPQLYLFER